MTDTQTMGRELEQANTRIRELEAEIDAMAEISRACRGERPLFIERRVYTPMPQKTVFVPKIVERRVVVDRPIEYLRFVPGPERVVYVQGHAGLFGRLGDWLDAWLGGY